VQSKNCNKRHGENFPFRSIFAGDRTPSDHKILGNILIFRKTEQSTAAFHRQPENILVLRGEGFYDKEHD
jgi:hypothetical protein